MRFINFFINSKWRLALTVFSLVVFTDEWSRFGFQGTAQIGALGIFLYSLTHAFGGAIFGFIIAAARFGVQKIRSGDGKISSKLINLVWTAHAGTMVYSFIQLRHF